MPNYDVSKSLDDSVAEVLGLLTGLDLQYDPNQDRYRIITRFLNQAVRRMALEHDWSYYSSTEQVGTAREGQVNVALRSSVRPRIIGDDAVRLIDPEDEQPRVWAYILPRDALSKYRSREGLWCATVRNTLTFSRPIRLGEAGLEIHVPVMREPKQFRLPPLPTNPEEEIVDVPEDVRNQLLDFDYPDVVIARAAYMYAQADPVMQPRAQTLEAEYKDLMYQLIERDDKHTDSADMNGFNVPIGSSIYDSGSMTHHSHPHADERWL